jgi:hypothetical protein
MYTNKKRGYLKGKVNELETNSNNKNISDSILAYMNLRRVTNLELSER